jgi:hypothetical protein
MTAPFPDREQARRLVTSLAVFWTAWGMALVGFLVAPAVAVVPFLVGMAFGLRFYLTLFRVWGPDDNVSVWKAMSGAGRRDGPGGAPLHLLEVFRPDWVRQTLRATDWNVRFVGFGLLALLAVDVVLALVGFPVLQAR